jgi:hypothetical protein
MHADLQQVLDLAPGYSRVSNPVMRSRDQACKRLADELRTALLNLPAGRGPGSGGAIGRQGSYSPVAWIRIFSSR